MTIAMLAIAICASLGTALAGAAAPAGLGQGVTLPSVVEGWTWDGRAQRYDARTVFDYIDGAGEMFLAYGFQQLTVRRFEKPGQPPLTLECYEMGSTEGAYGVFSFERQEPSVGIGQGSEFGGGLLRFWAGQYFISIFADGEGPAVESAVLIRHAEAVGERGAMNGEVLRGMLGNPIFLNATALVNVRPLRTHHWAGVGTCLKNYIQFVPDRPSYHPDGCAALGRIWTFPIVKGKTRLNVLSALTPQFYGRGANFFDRRYVWPYKGLIVGTDPVAVDTVGAHLLQVQRIAFFGEDRALDVTPHHIQVADREYHLGVSDLARIQLVKLGWTQDALI